MENLFLHIERLLAYHDYVIVPGLGGFVVQNQSAAVFHERVTPPLATIGFNVLMYHADGLLALETARAEGITYRQAVEKVQREVDSIKQQFTATDLFKFGNIGFFKRTAEGALLFTPVVNIDFLPLNSFQTNIYASAVERIIAVEKPAKHFSIAAILRYAAAAVLLVGLSTSVSDRNTEPDFQTANLLRFEIPKAHKAEILPAMPVADTLTATAETPVEPETEIKPAGSRDSYEVIVACLSTVNAAEKYCNTLKNSNFVNVHTFPGSRLHMVSLQNFQTRSDAVKYMREVRQIDSRFEQAWVFHKQKK